MPNRKTVIRALTRDVLGTQVWNGLIGETVNMPVDDYDRVEAAATAILERVASFVDWNRLLIEAVSRHLTVHECKPTKVLFNPMDICGECLREALLAEDTGAQNWEATSSTPLEHRKTDWPTIVAEELEHRSSNHPFKD